MKILAVVGARPNFVKIAPVLAEIRKFPWIESLLVHTGQHYDPEMSDCFFRDLAIPYPDVNLRQLGVARAEAASARFSVAAMAWRLEPVLSKEMPDIVLVVGDVDSTLAGALAAARLGIPVAHLEAGLRSFDLKMPEEINRIITDAISDLLLVSEPSGVRNLLNEGKQPNQIVLAGNLMIDTLKQSLRLAASSNVLEELDLRNGDGVREYALVTLHRAATVDSIPVLRGLWDALGAISVDIPLVFPVHPRTQKRFQEMGVDVFPGERPGGTRSVRFTSPLNYVDFLCLESNAVMVITDSGGVQEETTALGVACLTLRDNTERPITVLEGTNTIVGLDPQKLRREARRVLSGDAKTGRAPELWDGRAAERTVQAVIQHLNPRRGISCQPVRLAPPSARLSHFPLSNPPASEPSPV
jgi:UDP-N-acetylglucosamine 2-epimerase (non-hydrolysing)